MPNMKYVYFDLTPEGRYSTKFYVDYNNILEILFKICGRSIECLGIPDHDEPEDNTNPRFVFMPNLRHLDIRRTGRAVVKNILTFCPRLEFLQTSSPFAEWSALPNGFKKLSSDYANIEGLVSILCSPAVSTLESLTQTSLTPDICYKPFFLTCLHTLKVHVQNDADFCLLNLARILSVCPVLKDLGVLISTSDTIEERTWTKVLTEASSVTELHIKVSSREVDRIDVASWQDTFAETVATKLKKLQALYLSFHLSSIGLQHLSNLDTLEVFSHAVHTEHFSYETVFDTEALSDFLSTSLSKKLVKYEVQIPPKNPFGEYLIFKECFLKTARQLERKYFVDTLIEQNDRHYDKEIIHPEKIPGMIYVTRLQIQKAKDWDWICPEFEEYQEWDWPCPVFSEDNPLVLQSETVSQDNQILLNILSNP